MPTESTTPTSTEPLSAPTTIDAGAAAQRLLALLRELLQEIHAAARVLQNLSLDSHLDRDCALDSLARTELLQRIERTFHIRLDERVLVAETVDQVLLLILQAHGQAASIVSTPAPSIASGSALRIPERVQTLIEMLNWHVDAHPERVAIQIYGAHDQIESTFTYASLQQRARALATGLRERGLQVGETVAIMLPTSSEYFLSFFGILLAGAVPVPIYPPVRPTQIEEHLRRHARLLNNAEVVALITVPEAQLVARLLQAQVAGLRQVWSADELYQEPGQWRDALRKTQDLAFLQYTSGSTGDPKGVMLTHANLLANLRAMGAAAATSSEDVFISWLPLYHDMGLIGACFGSLYHGFPLVVMSPLSFLSRPVRWLRAIHQHRGTLSAAPNFAYELCVRSIQDHELEGLDLSCWRMALNGAEPVNPATLERFIARFAPYGFRRTSMAPVYGMAECSVGLALQPPDRGPLIDRIQRDLFMREGRAQPLEQDASGEMMQVPCCGRAIPDHQIRIVDAHGRELPERREGRLQFQGPSATAGYYRNPEATRRLFPQGDGWLDSGDRAYLVGSDVYLTGRVKDLIIRGGRNIYPYELEQAVGALPGIRKGCVAAFASADSKTGSERLVIVAETRTTQPEALEELRQQIVTASLDLLGTPPDDVQLVPPGAVLKTSSGKIRRLAIRDLYERGKLGQRGRALWWQLMRITLRSAWAQSRKTWRGLGEHLFAVYAWSVFAVLAPLTWLGIMLLPKQAWRWTLGRIATMTLAQLTGTSLQVRGLEHLPQGPCILAANHASFLDAYALMAVIPRHFHYVAKRELLDNRWIGKPLERIGTLFVERFDVQRSAEEARKVIEAARAGQSLGFFPEGTFKRMPGLLPFRMGAFIAATQADVPVIPVTMRGTRSMLRAHSWFPRRGNVEVIIEPPLHPDGEDWSAAVRLRDAVRAVILRHCHEPDAAD